MNYRNSYSGVFNLESGIALGVFVIIFLLLVVSLVRRRAGSGRRSSLRDEWTLVEGSYVLLLIGMATFLVVTNLTANNTEERPQGRPAVKVFVTGFQWCWRFHYEEQGITVQGTCHVGNDFPTMVLPTHRNVELFVTTSDVVHEFWLPHLDYKVQAIPGHVNTMNFSLAHTGRWLGHCAEFCGLFHAFMRFYVQAVPPSTFSRWAHVHHGSTIGR